MVKGQSYGLCYNCWNYKFSENNRNCQKYNFVFPKSTYDYFCRDYRRSFLKRIITEPQTLIVALLFGVPILLFYIVTGGWFYDFKSSRWRKRLKPSTLYFYMEQSQRPLQPLATFSELQAFTVLLNASVKIDTEYGISIQLDSSALTAIPYLGQDLEIYIDGEKLKFGVKGSFNTLFCLEPHRLSKLTDRQSALFFAQPASKTYKLLPNYFR